MTAGVKAARVLLGAVGVGVMAYGVQGFATARDVTARAEIGKWLVVGVIAHDALLAPTVFLLGAAAQRVTGARLRGRLAALLLIGGSLSLIAYPALSQKGANPNHTVLPLDYARNLSVLLAALASAVVLLSVVDAWRGRRAARRSRTTVEAIEAIDCAAEPALAPLPSAGAGVRPGPGSSEVLHGGDAEAGVDEDDRDGEERAEGGGIDVGEHAEGAGLSDVEDP